jgi:hypothetical protein
VNRTLVLATGFLILFVGGGARFAIGLALKPIAEELQIARGTLGLAVTAYLIVTSASMFLAGRSPMSSAPHACDVGLVTCR